MIKINKGLPYHGFDHQKVNEIFEGELTFVNEFCVYGEYYPVSVYRSSKPNRKKGHKKYLLLNGYVDGRVIVRGMSIREMKKWRYQNGVYCLSCKEAIYSLYRHNMYSCSCGNISIDGGRDYCSVSWEPGSSFRDAVIDLLNDRVKLVGDVLGHKNGLQMACDIAQKGV